MKADLIKHESDLERVQYFVFLSKEALLAFHDGADSFGESLKDRKCVVISTRVAQAARALGYTNITVSQARSVEAIVLALISLSSVDG